MTQITATFTRLLNPAQYEKAELTLSQTVDVAEGTDIDAEASTLARQVQARVLFQLGIGYSIDEWGVIVEDERAVNDTAEALGATVVPLPVPAPAAPVVPLPPATSPVAAVPPPPPVMPAPAPVVPIAPVAAPAGGGLVPGQNYDKDTLIADINANPGSWYDNRAQKAQDPSKSRNPDFRHKTLTGANGKNYAVWL